MTARLFRIARLRNTEWAIGGGNHGREGSEPAGILARMDIPGLRYRDHEESRFYQARALSPEQTWQADGSVSQQRPPASPSTPGLRADKLRPYSYFVV